MPSRAGIPNKRTSRASELFGPHVDDAITVIKDVLMRGRKECEHGKKLAVCPNCCVASPKDSDTLTAAKIILEYGLGKPIQPVFSTDNPEDAPDTVTIKFVKPAEISETLRVI